MSGVSIIVCSSRCWLALCWICSTFPRRHLLATPLGLVWLLIAIPTPVFDLDYNAFSRSCCLPSSRAACWTKTVALPTIMWTPAQVRIWWVHQHCVGCCCVTTLCPITFRIGFSSTTTGSFCQIIVTSCRSTNFAVVPYIKKRLENYLRTYFGGQPVHIEETGWCSWVHEDSANVFEANKVARTKNFIELIIIFN